MCRSVTRTMTAFNATTNTNTTGAMPLLALRRRRRVRFSASASSSASETTTATLGPIKNRALSEKDIHDRWYSRVDEKYFKLSAAIEFSNYKRKHQNKSELQQQLESKNHHNSNNYTAAAAAATHRMATRIATATIPIPIPRGLERHTTERRMHRKETIQLVLLAHRKGFHPHDIARLSIQRSRWNTQQATTQASLDRVEVLIDGAASSTNSASSVSVSASVHRQESQQKQQRQRGHRQHQQHRHHPHRQIQYI